MYMSILNLPREERYTVENVLVGVLPGPWAEPKKTMNSYLAPLVRELKQLWNGVVMKSASGGSIFVRAALICTACDIPASRKVSGFVSCNAYLGCSRCLKPRLLEGRQITLASTVPLGSHIVIPLIATTHKNIRIVL